MATIERIDGGYKVQKEYADYYRNEAGDWFADQAMTDHVEVDPEGMIDESDNEMIERFKRDPQLNYYVEWNNEQGFWNREAISVCYPLRQYWRSIDRAPASYSDRPTGGLYVTRNGNMSFGESPSGKYLIEPQEFEKLTSSIELSELITHDFHHGDYIDQLMELI